MLHVDNKEGSAAMPNFSGTNQARLTRPVQAGRYGARVYVHKRRGAGQAYRPAARPKVSIREAIAVVRAMATPGATMRDLTRATQVSRATVYRLLANCERELGMRIECQKGTYKV